MSQLGAEIEQSVQNLEQEMKVSENQLNYLEARVGPIRIQTYILYILIVHTYCTYIHKYRLLLRTLFST